MYIKKTSTSENYYSYKSNEGKKKQNLITNKIIVNELTAFELVKNNTCA